MEDSVAVHEDDLREELRVVVEERLNQRYQKFNLSKRQKACEIGLVRFE